MCAYRMTVISARTTFLDFNKNLKKEVANVTMIVVLCACTCWPNPKNANAKIFLIEQSLEIRVCYD